MRRELRPHIPAVKCGAHSRLASTVQAIGLQDMESVVPSEVGPSESGVQEGGGASMGPGGTLDWGAPGPSQQPVESLASGLGLAPWWPGLFRGLHHDAGHLGPGGSLSSCQLLGLKDGLGPGQARSFPLKPGSLALNLEHVLSVYEEPQEAGQKQQLFSSQKKSRNSSKRRQEASSTRKDFVLSPRSNAVITG